MKPSENLISIIVPVYNKADYLAECLESLQAQTYEDIEVVLVDDGSTDASPSICRTFCEQDARFHYLRQENGGQNAARRTGIEAAHGIWAMFVDADDVVIPEMCACLMARRQETGADLVMATLQPWSDGVFGTVKPIPSGVCSGREAVQHFIEDCFFQFCLPSGLLPILYRKQSVETSLQSIDPRITFSEDVGCSITTLLETELVAFLPKVVYYYRQTPESYCHSHDKSNVLTQKWLLAHLRELFTHHGIGRKAAWIADWIILRDLLLGGYEFFNDYEGVYPFFSGRRDGRIAVYGAGVLGEEIVTKLAGFDIVGWYDRDWQRYRRLGRNVDAPEKIASCECDAIIVAIQSPATAAAVQQSFRRRVRAEIPIHVIEQEIIQSDYSRQKLEELKNLDEDYHYDSYR